MSEVNEINETFIPDSREPYPDLYLDSLKLHEISSYEDIAIEALVRKYFRFLEREDILPGHRVKAQANFRRALFEKTWRSGYYDKCPDYVGDDDER